MFESTNSTYFLQNTTTIITIKSSNVPITTPAIATHLKPPSSEIELNQK